MSKDAKDTPSKLRAEIVDSQVKIWGIREKLLRMADRHRRNRIMDEYKEVMEMIDTIDKLLEE